MITNAVFERAANILRHIERNGPVAVFCDRGVFRTSRATSEFAARAIETHPQHLVGIYDAMCREEWLADDMQYMLDQRRNVIKSAGDLEGFAGKARR